jgi:hypothetical protein
MRHHTKMKPKLKKTQTATKLHAPFNANEQFASRDSAAVGALQDTSCFAVASFEELKPFETHLHIRLREQLQARRLMIKTLL